MSITTTAANMLDYAQIYKTFQLTVPTTFNFGTHVVDAWAAKAPDADALFWVGEDGLEQHLSYADLARRSDQAANALTSLGLSAGERVLVVLPRVPAWWEALTGIFKAGLVASPGTTLLTARDLAYRIEACEASAVIVSPELMKRVDEALDASGRSVRSRIVVGRADGQPGWLDWEAVVRAAPSERAPRRTGCDDPAMLYFTSGTTAHPKMVLHTQASWGLGNEITGRFWLDLRPGDLHWNISDTGWGKAAWSSYFGPLICGATVFAQHSTGKFAANDVLRYLDQYPITTLCAPPTVYRMLVQEDLSGVHWPNLRHCVAAGEPLNPEVIEVWRQATGLTIRDGYGQTETVLLCANFPSLEVRPGSMGKPSPGVDLAVIDGDGNRLPPWPRWRHCRRPHASATGRPVR